MADDQAIQSFSRAYNQVRKLFDEDAMEECVAQAQELLEDPDLPRYHRIKTLILLAAAVESWQDKEDCLDEAQQLLGLVRRFHQRGLDIDADAALDELRTALDALKAEQIERQPSYESEDESAVARADVEVLGDGPKAFEDEAVLTRAENNDAEELARADPEMPAADVGSLTVNEVSQ